MAYTFPLQLEDFFDGLPIKSFTNDLSDAMEYSQTGAGEITRADLGPRLWSNHITIRTGTYKEIERIKARLNLLREAGASLLVHAMPFLGPQSDPSGVALTGYLPRLFAVNANNKEISVAGVPAGFQFQEGDFLSFTYGSNPVRYAMHQVVASKNADNNFKGAELRGTGVIKTQAGTVVEATYNPATGEGVLQRVSSGQRSIIGFNSLNANSLYYMHVTNHSLTHPVYIRGGYSGTIWVTIPPNTTYDGIFSYGSGGIDLGTNTQPDPAGVPVTVHSFAKVIGATVTDLEVRPHIRPGYALSAPVRLVKPLYKAVIEPGSVDTGKMSGQFGEGISFTLRQTLR